MRKNNFSWAYRKLNEKEVFSFHHPPVQLLKDYRIAEIGGYSWRDVEEIKWTEFGETKRIYAPNLVSELIRKSLIAKCHQMGLKFNSTTELHYFPDGLLERNRLPVTLPDGKKINGLVSCGERKYFKPNDQSEYYKYHLAPTFFIRRDLFEGFAALFRLKIHLTDTNGEALVNRKINSRRKHLCKNWWNDDWFKRILAVAKFLSDNEKIVIGDLPKEQVVLSANPISFGASGGINEQSLEMSSFERESLFLLQDDEDEDELSVTEEHK